MWHVIHSIYVLLTYFICIWRNGYTTLGHLPKCKAKAKIAWWKKQWRHMWTPPSNEINMLSRNPFMVIWKLTNHKTVFSLIYLGQIYGGINGFFQRKSITEGSVGLRNEKRILVDKRNRSSTYVVSSKFIFLPLACIF